MYEKHITEENGEVKELTEAQRIIDIVYNTLIDIEFKRSGMNPSFLENISYYRYALQTVLSREGIEVEFRTTDLVPFDVDPDEECEECEDEGEDTEPPVLTYNNPFIR